MHHQQKHQETANSAWEIELKQKLIWVHTPLRVMHSFSQYTLCINSVKMCCVCAQPLTHGAEGNQQSPGHSQSRAHSSLEATPHDQHESPELFKKNHNQPSKGQSSRVASCMWFKFSKHSLERPRIRNDSENCLGTIILRKVIPWTQPAWPTDMEQIAAHHDARLARLHKMGHGGGLRVQHQYLLSTVC